jgi:mRNA interferase HigB
VEVRNLRPVYKAMRKHASARRPLIQWMRIVQAAEWQSIVDARLTWPTADAVKGTPFTCFNIGGNNFRLIAIVSYTRQTIAIEEVLTHAEYTKRY